MDKLRVVDFGSYDFSERGSPFMMGEFMKIKGINVFFYINAKPFLAIAGDVPLEKLIFLDKLENLPLLRAKYSKKTGVMVAKSTMFFSLSYTPNEILNKDNIIRLMRASIIKVLREKYNINSFIEKEIPKLVENNDFYVEHDGRNKKVGSFIYQSYGEFELLGLGLSFTIDYDKADEIIRKDTVKFKQKGDFGNMLKNLIVGLQEINPNITYEDLVVNIYTEFAKRLNLEVFKDSPSLEEKEALTRVTKKYNSKEWLYNGKI